MSEPASFTEATSALMKRIQADKAEHERRMREDPAYRAEQEQREEEGRRDQEAEKARKEHARLEALREARIAKGIPERLWSFLDAYRAGPIADLPASVGKAHGMVEKFLAGKPGWSILLLAGPVGTGKTTEAAWFLDAPRVAQDDRWTSTLTPGLDDYQVTMRRLRDAAERECAPRVVLECKGLFVTAPELAKASTFDAEFWGKCENAPRLVIDDLGTERLDAPGQALANLGHLLSSRHAEQLPTLITLNLTRAMFESRYCAADGGRLKDRLAEAGWWTELTGPSLRRRLSLEEG